MYICANQPHPHVCLTTTESARGVVTDGIHRGLGGGGHSGGRMAGSIPGSRTAGGSLAVGSRRVGT